MSGGRFDYNKYRIREIWEDIQQELDKQGKEKSKEDLRYYDKEYFEKYPEERFENVYREDVQQIFKEAIKVLKKAEIYTQRIDWYLSGDDGEDSLVSRLKSELELLNETKNKIMETKKLKVGDKIIYIASSALGFTNGKEYEIFEINEEDFTYTVIDDKGRESFFGLFNFDAFFKLKEENAYKETEGKLFYELDFEFITQIAERMASNKGKYEPYNWQKLDNIEDLKQALFRHVLEIMKGNYEDDNREFGHLEAIACDVMMICYQLKKYKKL